MVITPLWADGMTAGRGWIALALVVFSGWRTGRLLAGGYFFGLFMTLELYAKASGFSFLPSQFWAAMPYLMAIIVLAIMSARETRRRRRAGLPRQDPTCPTHEPPSEHRQGEHSMTILTRRNFVKTAAAAVHAAAAGPQRLRRRAAEGRLHLSRAGRRFRLDLGA